MSPLILVLLLPLGGFAGAGLLARFAVLHERERAVMNAEKVAAAERRI